MFLNFGKVILFQTTAMLKILQTLQILCIFSKVTEALLIVITIQNSFNNSKKLKYLIIVEILQIFKKYKLSTYPNKRKIKIWGEMEILR
jgi:hypothetical protein